MLIFDYKMVMRKAFIVIHDGEPKIIKFSQRDAVMYIRANSYEENPKQHWNVFKCDADDPAVTSAYMINGINIPPPLVSSGER